MNIAIIRNADIYAPAPRGRGNILIINDKIAAMGPQVELPPWAADAAEPVEVDADGRVVTPGLMDGHVHITGGGGEAGFHTQVPPLPLSVPVTGGVTTIGGLLGTDGITRHVDNVLAKACSLEEEGLSTFIMMSEALCMHLSLMKKLKARCAVSFRETAHRAFKHCRKAN